MMETGAFKVTSTRPPKSNANNTDDKGTHKRNLSSRRDDRKVQVQEKPSGHAWNEFTHVLYSALSSLVNQ